MQQTTLQKAIEKFQNNILWIEKNVVDGFTRDSSIMTLKDCIKELQSLLPSERKDIEDAYESGFVLDPYTDETTPSEYFTTTFITDNQQK